MGPRLPGSRELAEGQVRGVEGVPIPVQGQWCAHRLGSVAGREGLLVPRNDWMYLLAPSPLFTLREEAQDGEYRTVRVRRQGQRGFPLPRVPLTGIPLAPGGPVCPCRPSRPWRERVQGQQLVPGSSQPSACQQGGLRADSARLPGAQGREDKTEVQETRSRGRREELVSVRSQAQCPPEDTEAVPPAAQLRKLRLKGMLSEAQQQDCTQVCVAWSPCSPPSHSSTHWGHTFSLSQRSSLWIYCSPYFTHKELETPRGCHWPLGTACECGAGNGEPPG